MNHSFPKPVMFVMTAGMFVAFTWADANEKSRSIKIGVAHSFIASRSKAEVDIAADELKDVLKKTTGLTGDLLFKDGAMEVAKKLDAKQLDVGIFYAHEFAWAQKKYPDLRPLLIAAGEIPEAHAYLIVHKNSAAKAIGDLQGKTLDLPASTPEYCRLFLERLCLDKTTKEPAAFFRSIAKSEKPAAALDQVCAGKGAGNRRRFQRWNFTRRSRGRSS